MNIRVSKLAVVVVLLTALQVPVSAATRDERPTLPGVRDRFERVLREIKRVLHLTPNEEWPAPPKP